MNTILKFVDPRAIKFFNRVEFLTMSESMLTSIIQRSTLNITETVKFQVMLQWASNKVKGKSSPAMATIREHGDAAYDKMTGQKFLELQAIMTRLTRELKLHKIPPQDLIKVR